MIERSKDKFNALWWQWGRHIWSIVLMPALTLSVHSTDTDRGPSYMLDIVLSAGDTVVDKTD